MLSGIYLYNFSGASESQRSYLESFAKERGYFHLQTCQRTIILSQQPEVQVTTSKLNTSSLPSYELMTGDDAYAYLLEIICGLKSKLIGENEIVSQFKQAYKVYQRNPHRKSCLMLVLEKLFQDSKDIRTKYLIGIAQKTYSSLARKILLSQHKATNLLILGSGQLAEDMINQMKKKVHVTIVARNSEKTRALCEKHNIESLEWSDITSASYQCLREHSFIVNTIGTQEEILKQNFFDLWQKSQAKCFVDLASPSPYKNAPSDLNEFYQLDDIFELGAIKEQKKSQQIQEAKTYLKAVVSKRSVFLKNKLLAKLQTANYETINT